MPDLPGAAATAPRPGPQVRPGIFVRCEGCSEIIYGKALRENQEVCPRCDHHRKLPARQRLSFLLDDGEYHQLCEPLRSNDPLGFRDRVPYPARIEKGVRSTGLDDAVLVVRGRLERTPVVVAAMEYGFIGGSMGVVVGEQITRAVETAIADRAPLIIISCSGGARMQEGALSLMQMAKISAALALLDDAGVAFISVLTNPTTGGVTASYAMLGDLNVAEPGALIGFAGPRVIQQTIRGELPEGFQRSEFLLEHGMLDRVVHRKELRSTLGRLLRFLHDPEAAPAQPQFADAERTRVPVAAGPAR